MKSQIVAVVAAVLLSFSGRSACGGVQYTVTDLGTFGGSSSNANDINNSGHVVGWADTAGSGQHAFLYSGRGSMRDLGTLPGGSLSCAIGTNNNGHVVGWADTGSGQHAFLYSGSGPMRDLGTLGGNGSKAWGINSNGRVVGEAQTADGKAHAFLYSGSGPMQDLGTLLGGSRIYAYRINNRGQVVGGAFTADGKEHAFLYSRSDPVRNLGTLPGGSWSCAIGINNNGQIVGWAETGSGQHAFLYSGSDPMRDLGTLPGGSISYADSINNSGKVVGYAYTAAGYIHAFLYNGSTMIDLNSLIDPVSGWTLTQATAINDVGQIVGKETNSAGQSHAFLLTPIPEPSNVKEPQKDAGEKTQQPQKEAAEKTQETESQKRQGKAKALLEEISKAIEEYSDTELVGTDVAVREKRAIALDKLLKKFEGREVYVAFPIGNVSEGERVGRAHQVFRSGAKTALTLFRWQDGFCLRVLKPTIRARNQETGQSIEVKPLDGQLRRSYDIETGDVDLPAACVLRVLTVKVTKEDALKIDDKWTLEISGKIQFFPENGRPPRSRK